MGYFDDRLRIHYQLGSTRRPSCHPRYPRGEYPLVDCAEHHILTLAKAGFFPGVVYLLSTWYQRCKSARSHSTWSLLTAADEVGKRYSIFYCIGCVASAFGGILAFGLIHMEGVAGYLGWRWIFIIEGIVCSKIWRQTLT